jgi:hypothetical protein
MTPAGEAYQVGNAVRTPRYPLILTSSVCPAAQLRVERRMNVTRRTTKTLKTAVDVLAAATVMYAMKLVHAS